MNSHDAAEVTEADREFSDLARAHCDDINEPEMVALFAECRQASQARLIAKLQSPTREMRKAGVDAAPMSEPKKLSGGLWGRESINDDQCVEIYQAMLAAAIVDMMGEGA